MKFSLPSGVNIALDPRSMCFTCAKCDAAFLTDAINDKMEQTDFGTTNNKQNETCQTPQKNVFTTTKSTIQGDLPITFTQLKQDISKMVQSLYTVQSVIETSAANICEIKTITTDTNAIVKSHNNKSSEFNNDLSTKINELSSQTQTFSNIVKQSQQTDKRTPVVIKRRILTDKKADDKPPNSPLPSKSKPTSSKPKDVPQPKTGKRVGSFGLMAAPKPKPKPKFDKALHVSTHQLQSIK